MNDKNFQAYKEKFFTCDLNSQEEEVFKNITSKNSGTKYVGYQAYFSLKNHLSTNEFLPISKESLFEKIQRSQKSIKQHIYWAAASFIGILIVSSLFFWQYEKAQKTISKSEIDQSIEVTRMALNSISTHINTSLGKVDKGLDFSITYQTLSNINSTQHK